MRYAVAFLATVLLTTAPLAARARFIAMGDLPGGLDYSRAEGVSADGRLVIGESVSDAV